MTPSFTILTLASILAGANIPAVPTWEKDYAQARQQALSQRKPLLVVVAAGETGWQKLTQEGTLTDDTRRTLSQKFVCVFLNGDSTSGKRAAEALGVKNQPGVVISDRKAELMAFRHSGALSQQELALRLARYADPAHLVTTTESVVPPAPAVVPTSYFGDCPNCRRY